MSVAIELAVLLLVILNPFALSVYLMELMEKHRLRSVAGITARASVISGVVFLLFALAGDRIFQNVLHVRFAAFQVFGGILFVLIGIRFMLNGGDALVRLRGEPEHVAGTIAMPFMIGPGSVSAAVLIGSRLEPMWAVAVIVAVMLVTYAMLVGLKALFDHVRERNTRLIERYTDITGRVAAVVIGTIAVEMLFQGLESFWKSTSMGQ